MSDPWVTRPRPGEQLPACVAPGCLLPRTSSTQQVPRGTQCCGLPECQGATDDPRRVLTSRGATAPGQGSHLGIPRLCNPNTNASTMCTLVPPNTGVLVHTFFWGQDLFFIIFPKAMEGSLQRRLWGAVGRSGVRPAWTPIPAHWVIVTKRAGLPISLTCSTGHLGWQDKEPRHGVAAMFSFHAWKHHSPHSWESWACSWNLPSWKQPAFPGQWALPSLWKVHASVSYVSLPAASSGRAHSIEP